MEQRNVKFDAASLLQPSHYLSLSNRAYILCIIKTPFGTDSVFLRTTRKTWTTYCTPLLEAHSIRSFLFYTFLWFPMFLSPFRFYNHTSSFYIFAWIYWFLSSSFLWLFPSPQGCIGMYQKLFCLRDCMHVCYLHSFIFLCRNFHLFLSIPFGYILFVLSFFPSQAAQNWNRPRCHPNWAQNHERRKQRHVEIKNNFIPRKYSQPVPVAAWSEM